MDLRMLEYLINLSDDYFDKTMRRNEGKNLRSIGI